MSCETVIELILCVGYMQDFLGATLPESVTIVEVGPRDGLQNEKRTVLDLISLAAVWHPFIEER